MEPNDQETGNTKKLKIMNYRERNNEEDNRKKTERKYYQEP